jgi:hypothetical protein
MVKRRSIRVAMFHFSFFLELAKTICISKLALPNADRILFFCSTQIKVLNFLNWCNPRNLPPQK